MINKASISNYVGRALTEQETRIIDWLNGWDADTYNTVGRLIQSAYENGRQAFAIDHAKGMTAEDIQQFAEALAARYKEVSDAWVQADPNNHRAMDEYRLFHRVINTLPREVAGPFWAECHRLFKTGG